MPTKKSTKVSKNLKETKKQPVKENNKEIIAREEKRLDNNQINKVLYREGRYFYWRTGDLHTDAGFITEKEIKESKNSVKSNIGKEFKVFEPNVVDLFFKIKRGPQIITKKDIGFILTETGITNESKVLDAGTGSAHLALNLSLHAKEVISYEKRDDFYKLSLENKEFLKVKNLTIKNKDIYNGIDEKEIDTIILDLPEPFRVVDHAFNALKQGGFLVAYLPSMIQVQNFIKEAKKKFTIIKVSEIIERNWIVDMDNEIVRPEFQMLGHTAFLCLVRKI